MAKERRQAVIVIHGMGEQRPMETLRSFVTTIWVKDRNLTDRSSASDKDNEFWSSPDARTGSLELRRLTTPKDKNGVRTDFYEFYWADVMEGTLASHLWSWVRGLLLRKPNTVPFDVLHAWIVLWLLAILVGLLFLVAFFNDPKAGPWKLDALAWLTCTEPVAWMIAHPFWVGTAAAALGILLHSFLVPYFGDVARYARATPANVGKRREILERGLELLWKVHNDDNETLSYYRVVVVGHSLGSIIAYDLLTHFWVEFYKSYRLNSSSKLSRIYEQVDEVFDQENVQAALKPEYFSRTHFSCLQEKLQAELRIQKKKPWRITDFVTVGSPLTHAEFLIARDERALLESQRLREMPTCPPTPERDCGRWTITYRPDKNAKQRLPNHATVFASVRWTNIYCRNWLAHVFLIPGDIISGPVVHHFGPGVHDRRVWIWNWKTLLFAHTAYWRWKDSFDPRNPPDHIRVLREAVKLAERADHKTGPRAASG